MAIDVGEPTISIFIDNEDDDVLMRLDGLNKIEGVSSVGGGYQGGDIRYGQLVVTVDKGSDPRKVRRRIKRWIKKEF